MCSRAFVGALCPAQARAIARLQFLCHDGECPAFEMMRHLKNPEYVSIQLVEDHYEDATYEFWSMFEQLRTSFQFYSRIKLDLKALKSFHIAVVDRNYPAAVKESLVERLKDLEKSLQQRVV